MLKEEGIVSRNVYCFKSRLKFSLVGCRFVPFYGLLFFSPWPFLRFNHILPYILKHVAYVLYREQYRQRHNSDDR